MSYNMERLQGLQTLLQVMVASNLCAEIFSPRYTVVRLFLSSGYLLDFYDFLNGAEEVHPYFGSLAQMGAEKARPRTNESHMHLLAPLKRV